MADDFNTLSNRLLNRCPSAGLPLAQQFVNDAWATLQSRREWSFRRASSTFAPPDIYSLGQVTTNVATGSPTLLSGTNTVWTPQMVGRQIRIGGLLYPFYTISGYLSATQLLIDQPWAGPDVTLMSYTMQQCYFPVPQDFGYFYSVVSVKDGYRLWTNLTEADLNMLDPQRTNFGQSYALAFRDYTQNFKGVIYPAQPLGTYAANVVSTTSAGFSYPIAANYLVQIVTGGLTGAATYMWTRIGNSSGYSLPITTSTDATDLSDGVQIYFPSGATWTTGNTWVINAQPTFTSGVPRYEMWPAPTFSAYLYPYIYIKKECSLTVTQPQLPPFIANRGEVLLEMALQKCAEFPGADSEHPNIYHDLRQASYHGSKADAMIMELERNDEEVGVSNIDYECYPFYPAPWATGQWQQTHAQFLNG